MRFAKLCDAGAKLVKELFLQHILALFLIPNPKRYIGYKWLFIREVEYFPLGGNRWEYLLNCIRQRVWPWQTDAALKLLVDRINERQGFWQQLLHDPAR